MSYHGNGYRRKHQHRDREDVEHREVLDTAEQKLKTAILKMGEVDPSQEIPRLVDQICGQPGTMTSTIVDSLRIGVTEQPFKIPYYAALVRALSIPLTVPSHSLQGPEFGKQILDDIWKGFQASLDRLAWRDIRLSIHFFAHLSVANVISLRSMYDLIRAVIVILDEFGVSHGRAKQAVRCACEGLMIVGSAFNNEPSASMNDIIVAIRTYVQSTARLKRLVQPVTSNFLGDVATDIADELLDSALSALEVLQTSKFHPDIECLPRPYSDTAAQGPVVFDLPSVLVPPEIIELDGVSIDSDAPIKKAEWAEFYVHLFDDDVTPNPTSPAGYIIRSGILDLVDIFEVNRKECARLLLEYPKWTVPGTFKTGHDGLTQIEGIDKNWQLECTIIEYILGQLFLLPESSHKSIYYISLITELCKLSPSNVGPAVGKSIRKMYSLLSDGLDVAVADRLANWFSIHMSNFNFMWVWKEWIGDLELSILHPKRVFMRRAVEYEIRLSYHDRIVRTLPERMQSSDAHVLPNAPPGPIFAYDDPVSAHHDAARSVLELLRGRARAEDVITHLEELKNNLETTDNDLNVTTAIRSIAVQSLLHIGSRSFSHFLNAIERYLPLLRNLAAGGISSASGPSSEARSDILSAVLAFWKSNKHMVVIVLDKLMQYQIVDPTDVVAWAFLHAGSDPDSLGYSCNAFQWDLIRGALDKANGRVAIARHKLVALRKEDDDNAARAMASHGATMDIDEKQPDPIIESPALAGAMKAYASLAREQKAVLTQTVEGFYQCVVSPTTPIREVITAKAWHSRASWTEVEWSSWETWAWYQHFCRTYSPYLRIHTTTIEAHVLAKSTAGDPELFKQIWNIATGQDV